MLKKIRSDRGEENLTTCLMDFTKQEDIQQEYTAPNTLEQNRVAERKSRSLVKITRRTLSVLVLWFSWLEINVKFQLSGITHIKC
jgi:hypothetical protein